MRILHINLERGWRGGERQTLYLMEGLKKLGYENHLMTRKNDLFIQQALKCDFTPKIIKKPFLLHGPFLRHFDIIQLHEVRGLQLAVFWKFLHGQPLVFTRRVDNMPSNHVFTRFKYNQVDHLIAISGKIKSVMVEWGFDPGRISVIPSAVSLVSKAQPAQVQKLKQRFSGRKIVGCVAALEDRKDHFTLLDAATLVNRQRSDVVFVLLGEGVLREKLEAKAKELSLNNIFFEGYQNDPHSYYPIFDVFLITSKSEGLCSAILDAFFYRIPVVATATGGIPDLVISEKTGLLCPVGNPQKIAQDVLRMLDDPDLRNRFTTKAYRSLARHFSISVMAEAYDQVYRGVASS
jgi:glycosyltransferase involved in cell wall biosynthesis